MMTTDYNPNIYLNENNVAAFVAFFYADNIIQEQKELFEKSIKFSKLKENIGEDLFNQLSEQQKEFMESVGGKIVLGKNIDTNHFLSSENDYE